MALFSQTQEPYLFSDNEMPSYIYTYPTKGSYQPFTDWRKACASWMRVEGPIALYIHIPFCEMKCTFCDLFTATKQPDALIERYLRGLLKEIDIVSSYLNREALEVRSVYFGGGTPTLLSQAQLSKIIDTLKQQFRFSADAEWSIEGAPNSYSREKFEELHALGFNRASIGVQTFDPAELRQVGRPYAVDLGPQCAREAVASQIENINLDLIYGLPGQKLETWLENLEQAIALGPHTLTLYPLAVRSRTVLGKQIAKGRAQAYAEAEERYRWYDAAYARLMQAGYAQRTFVTFAKKSGGCGHEAMQFTGVPTLAFGAGARKYAPALHYADEDYNHRQTHLRTLMEYLECVERGELLVRSAVSLSEWDQSVRLAILGLLSSGLSKQRIPDAHWESFLPLFRELESEGYLAQSDSHAHLTSGGMRYSNHIGQWLVRRSYEEAVV